MFQTGTSEPMMLAVGVGMTVSARRLPPAPRLTAAEAAGYVGRYRSDELDTWAVVEARGDTVKVRTRWGEWRTLDPIALDIFVGTGTQVAFDRNRQGRVTGHRLSAARTLNVRFRRETPPPG